jgi:hypothetical protein
MISPYCRWIVSGLSGYFHYTTADVRRIEASGNKM